MEIYKDSGIYNSPSIYESGAGGGGGGAPYLKNIVPTKGVKVVDENGFIGGDFLRDYYTNDYNNFAVVFPGADYSDSGLGSVIFYDPNTSIGGRVYRTVTINGVTWLAENLDYKFSGCGVGGSGAPGLPNSWYYNNDENTYGIDGTRKCGLLYNWYAVKLLSDNSADLIPGWHVPTKEEYSNLIDFVGGSGVAGARLKAANVNWANSWGGTDDYGFGVLPAGLYFDSFIDEEYSGYLWTISESGSDAYYIGFNTDATIYVKPYYKNRGYSVRLVKD